jgi:hypothetical protein
MGATLEVSTLSKLEGVLTPATVDLATALRHLRKPTDVRVLWIDALSINRSDNGERGHQVKARKDIYSNSRVTRVWLGLAGPDNDLAFDFFFIVCPALEAAVPMASHPASCVKLCDARRTSRNCSRGRAGVGSGFCRRPPSRPKERLPTWAPDWDAPGEHCLDFRLRIKQ